MNTNYMHNASPVGHFDARNWPLGVTIEGELLKCCRNRTYFTRKSSSTTKSMRYFKLSEVDQRLCWSKKLNSARPCKSLDLRRARLTLMQGGDDGDFITIQPHPTSNLLPLSLSADDGETLLKWYSRIIVAIEGPQAHSPEDLSMRGGEIHKVPGDGIAGYSNIAEQEPTTEGPPPPPPLPIDSEFSVLKVERIDSDEEPAPSYNSDSSSVLACFGISESLWTLPVPRLNPLQQETDEWTNSPGGIRTRFRVVKT